MVWSDGLRGPALEIAKTDARRLRVMAGPGTGKSYALKHRIKRLIEQGQDPSRIWAVTFTRNAAESLFDDITGSEPPDYKRIRISTLHAYCFGLLRNNAAHTGRIPRIVTKTSSRRLPFEHGVLMHDLIYENPEFDDDVRCAARIEELEAGWVNTSLNMPDNQISTLLESHLSAWLGFHNAMLISELIPETLRLLRSGHASGALAAFDHVIVDEYQDLNEAEQEIIDLVSGSGSLAIVGDVNQSIYSFRQAHWQGMEGFQEKYPDTCDVQLVSCRRNPTRVVKMANSLIANNHQPDTPPNLQSRPENPDGEIHTVHWNTIDEEADGIAKYVKHLIDNGEYNPEDILIMIPRKILGQNIQQSMSGQNISVNFEQEALAEGAAQRALALLTLLVDSEDRVALRWWLGQNSNAQLSDAYQKLREYCETSGKSPRAVLEDMMHGRMDLSDVLPLLEPFRNLVGEIDRLSRLDPHDLVDDLLPEGNDDCAVLRNSAKRALADNKGIRQVYQTIMEDIHQPKYTGSGSVRVMTMHKAKGLTSKVVIVACCCNELIPFRKNGLSEDQRVAEMSEQRRLFYVAITRCKKILVISYFTAVDDDEHGSLYMSSREWDQNTQRFSVAPSSLIDELGPTAPPAVEGAEWQAAKYKQAGIDPI